MTNRFSMSEREFPNVHSFEAVNNKVAVVKEKKKKRERNGKQIRETQRMLD